MVNCIICKEPKIATRDGFECKLLGVPCDAIVEFCKFFKGEHSLKTKEPRLKNSKKRLDNNILEKIQKLFQLGKSPNMHEAAAALRKAQDLMDEYDLSFGEVNYITEFERLPGKKVYTWELTIWTAVCNANNCYPGVKRGAGSLSLAGRKINVFLSQEMFRYLIDAVLRLAKKECKGKGHKYNSDFKMAAAYQLEERLSEYGERVSWAVDREQELKNIKEYRNLKKGKKEPSYSFGDEEAIVKGLNAGKSISLVKQTGIDEIKRIGANV
jgi:hypothetical protein